VSNKFVEARRSVDDKRPPRIWMKFAFSR
jgi:hypothetical protein